MESSAQSGTSRTQGPGKDIHPWTTVGSWIAGLGFTAMFAAGTFNAVALMPNWYGSNADGILLMRELLARGPTGMRTFFVPVALVTLASLALAVAGGLRGPRRTRILLAAGMYAAVMVVTFGFLLPLDLQLFQDSGEPVSTELVASANRYVLLHLLRLLLLAAGAASALGAAARPPKTSEAPHAFDGSAR